MNNNKISILVRTCVLFVALINQMLLVFGYSILPISEEQISELCTTLFTVIVSLWTWWTNNKIE